MLEWEEVEKVWVWNPGINDYEEKENAYLVDTVGKTDIERE